MKPLGASCAWTMGEDMLSPAGGFSLLCGLIPFPFLEIRLRHHLERGPHLVVPQAAKFRARHFVGAGLICLEVERNLHAWYDVLLQPQLANEEVVDHIAGSHDQQNRLSNGNFEGSAAD